MKRRFRPLGGLAGVAIALAGGFGVAVGTYSLPEVNHAHAGLSAYGPGQTQAGAVWKGERDGAYTELYVDASRRTVVGEDGTAGPDGSLSLNGRHQVSQGFGVFLRTCYPGDEWCNETGWSSEIPPGTFEFDPALRSAHVAGTAWCDWWSDCNDETQECSFDVRWTGTGEAGPQGDVTLSGGRTFEGDSGTIAGAGTGISRVATVEIDACFGSFDLVPGYLSVGAGSGAGWERVH